MVNYKWNIISNSFVPFQNFCETFTQNTSAYDHYLRCRNGAHGLVQLKLERKTFTYVGW